MNLQNKNVLITGGSSGLGFEIAKQLLEKGSRVYLLGRNQKNIEKTVLNLKIDESFGKVCDVRHFNEVKKVILEIERIDVLINCAGIINYQKLEEQSAENIKEIIETNLLGTIYVTKEVYSKMKRQNSGTIINISSTSGLLTGGHAYEAVYIASKFGVTGFTHGLKKEVEKEGKNIRVLGFHPGGMNTKLFEKAGVNKETDSFMDPSEIAKILIFMLEQSDSIKMDQVVINRNKNV